MRRNIIKNLSILTLLCLGLGPIYAQSSSSGDPGGFVFPEEEISSMSSQEKLSRSGRAIQQMQGQLTGMINLIEQARKDEDVLKLNCLNQKLSALRGFLKVGEKANLDLQKDVRKNDVDSQKHQIKLVFLAESRVQSIRDSAESCGEEGNGELFLSPTKRITNINPDIREDGSDGTGSVGVDESMTEGVTTERLPEVSPYQ